MDTRKQYEVNVLGIKHSMLLTEDEAVRYGDNATLLADGDPNPLTPVDDRAAVDGDVVVVVAEAGDDDFEDFEEEEEEEEVELPSRNASLAQWQEYARSLGATDEDLDGVGRDQLRDTYGA